MARVAAGGLAHIYLDVLLGLGHRDGFIRYVISASDPGVHNWVDTAGHLEGYVFLRWQRLGRDLSPDEWPRAEVIDAADLAARLPPTTPRVSDQERAAQWQERQSSPLRQR